MANRFLFPDEIAEILRSAPHWSLVAIPNVVNIRVSDSAVDYDGIRVSERNYFDDHFLPYAKRFFSEHAVSMAVYDAIESGSTVTVNNQNILTM